MEILRYGHEHEHAVLSAIRQDPDWEMFTREDAVERYKERLLNCVTYVCFEDEAFCGYLRAIADDGFALYVSELYVLPAWRNRQIGRSLVSRIKSDFKALTVYLLSDEDSYYQKLGHQQLGSIFEIQA